MLHKFKQPIPDEFFEIRQQVKQKISSLPLVQACARGDDEAIRRLVVDFYPYIHIFPSQIRRATISMARKKFLTAAQEPHWEALQEETSTLLPSIRADEEVHHTLWVKMASAIGIALTDAHTVTSIDGMKQLIALMDEKVHPTVKLLYFSTVEIVAEALSEALLASDVFRRKVSELGWFHVHAEHHSEETHETLTLRLAHALWPEELTLTEVAEHMHQAADAFVGAANDCFGKAYAA